MNNTTFFTVENTNIIFNNSQIESLVKTDTNIIIRFNTGTKFNISTVFSDESNNYFKVSQKTFDML